MTITVGGSNITFPDATTQNTAGVSSVNGLSGAVTIPVAKAWANFSLTGGTVTINKSYNISGIIRNSTGNFTVTFTTALTDTNYAVVGSASWDSSSGIVAGTVGPQGSGAYTTTSCAMFCGNGTGAALDCTRISIVFFD